MSVIASLRPFVDRGSLAGAVTLVTTRDRVLSVEAIGHADRERGQAMRTDAFFWIASISKPITGTALMMLVDEGKIDIAAPVERYLPEFTGQTLGIEQADGLLLRAPKRPITVRDVMAHTSGLPFFSRVERTIDGWSLREAALSYALSPLRFEPGSKYEYCNAGINTAGRIIEVVSGQPFEDFVQQRLFDPLGMHDTTFWPNAAQLQRLATVYRPTADKKGLEPMAISQTRYPLSDRTRGPSPAGGYFSTAQDMALFAQLILGGGVFAGKRLLSAAALATMTSKQTGDLEQHYGLGWGLDPAGNGFGHGGAYATDLFIDPKLGIGLIYLVQHAGYGNDDGAEIHPTFKRAALAAFSPAASGGPSKL